MAEEGDPPRLFTTILRNMAFFAASVAAPDHRKGGEKLNKVKRRTIPMVERTRLKYGLFRRIDSCARPA